MPQPFRFKGCQLARDERRPILAVDIGYSAKGKSCGIYWTGAAKPLNETFGQSIQTVAECLAQEPDAILVLEAVLSTYHDPTTGNPDLRNECERGRGWYWGPGAVSCLAAQRFLRMLGEELPSGRQVLLAEAFLSNKPGPSKHGRDAELIVKTFWDAPVYQPAKGSEPLLEVIEGIPEIRVFNPAELWTNNVA